MAQITEGPSVKSVLRSILVFELTMGFLLSTLPCKGQGQKVPYSVVTAMAGDEAVLPCRLKSPTDIEQVTVEWGRPDLKPRFVYVLHNMQEFLSDQNTAFSGRTSLSMDKMKQGDVSLKLSDLRPSDNGTYRCFISAERREYFVDLIVGVASSPRISLAGLDEEKSRVVLQCESAGWYPQPELFWLDDEGTLLSAAPTETVPTPDGLFTVSSRVTVEKRHNSSFLCRVHQKNTNQTRETHIHVPDDFFLVLPTCTASVIFNVVFCTLSIVLPVAIFIWKWRQSKTSTNRTEERRQLVTDLHGKILDVNKLKLEQNLKILQQAIKGLTDIKKELENPEKILHEQKEQAAIEAKANDEKIRAGDDEVRQKEGEKGQELKAQAYLKLKGIVQEAKYQLEGRRKDQQESWMNTGKLVRKACEEVKRLMEMKKEMESLVDIMGKQKEEIKTTSGKNTKPEEDKTSHLNRNMSL